MIGLDFYANGRDPAVPGYDPSSATYGVQVVGRVEGFLLEDCRVRNYLTNVIVRDGTGPIRDVTIRRCVVTDAYGTLPHQHPQGLFVDGVTNFRLLESVFDHNGWDERVPGAGATIYNHNVYITGENYGTIEVRGNVFANASSHGLQARAGGLVEGNVFLNNPIGLSFGLVNGDGLPHAGGVSGAVIGNLFMGGGTIRGEARGTGLEVANTRPEARVSVANNIFSHGTGVAGPAISITKGRTGDEDRGAVGINDLTVVGNVVYKWPLGLQVNRALGTDGNGANTLRGLAVWGNDFQHGTLNPVMDYAAGGLFRGTWSANRYHGEKARSGWFRFQGQSKTPEQWKAEFERDAVFAKAAYAEPARSPDSYGASLPGAPAPANFLAEARRQSSQQWRPQYLATALIQHVRAGFWVPSSAPVVVSRFPERVPTTTADGAAAFVVAYIDREGAVDVSSLGDDDLTVVGPNGPLPVTFLGHAAEPGGVIAATYRAGSPRGKWRIRDTGAYAVSLAPGQVRDAEGNTTAPTLVDDLQIDVRRWHRPVTVKSVKLRGGRGRPHELTVRFNSGLADAASPVPSHALVLTPAGGGEAIAAQFMQVRYDGGARAVTWTFPGLAGGVLPAGRYQVTLLAQHILDDLGNALDGDNNRKAGGDFVPRKALRSRG